MSWRLVRGALALLVVVFGSSGIVKAQDDAADKSDSSKSKTGKSVKEAWPPVETATDDAKSAAKSSPAKVKTSTSKARASKSRMRANSKAAAGSGTSERKYELATFGGGCFWHVEADFERLNGVISAVSGYAGGQ